MWVHAGCINKQGLALPLDGWADERFARRETDGCFLQDLLGEGDGILHPVDGEKSVERGFWPGQGNARQGAKA